MCIRDRIWVSQEDYIMNNIKDCQVPTIGRSNWEKLEGQEISEFRKSVGKMRWITDQTRPDLAFDELLMSTKQKEPTVGDVKKINKMATIARDPENQLWLKYAKIESDVWYITVFTDASLGNMEQELANEEGETVRLKKSALGYFITMSAGYHYQEKDRTCPITVSYTHLRGPRDKRQSRMPSSA